MNGWRGSLDGSKMVDLLLEIVAICRSTAGLLLICLLDILAVVRGYSCLNIRWPMNVVVTLSTSRRIIRMVMSMRIIGKKRR